MSLCSIDGCRHTDSHHHIGDYIHVGVKLDCIYASCSRLLQEYVGGLQAHPRYVAAEDFQQGVPIGVTEEGRIVMVNPNSKAYPNGMFRDEVVKAVEQVFSSTETWEATPEDHRAETPARFLSMLHQMTTRDPEFNFTTFNHTGPSEMITLGPIPFYTLCAHHVVPFFGNAWVGYVPRYRLVGLSKIPRAVKHLAKGFWVQETLTTEIADYLESKLDPLGVAVVMEAEHMCMAMRGVEVAGVLTRTSAMRGVFADHDRTAKAEFMEGLKNDR